MLTVVDNSSKKSTNLNPTAEFAMADVQAVTLLLEFVNNSFSLMPLKLCTNESAVHLVLLCKCHLSHV